MRTYKVEVAQVIQDYLESENFHFKFSRENGEFSMTMTMRGRLRSVNIRFFAGEEDFSTYVFLSLGPMVKNQAMMDKAAEFVVRVNYAICQGCFDLDLDDGEIRFKIVTNFEGLDVPTKDMVENSLLRALHSVEEYSDKLAYLLYCDVTAQEAYEADLDVEGYFPRVKSSILDLEGEDDDDDDEDDDEDEDDDLDDVVDELLGGEVVDDDLLTRLRLLRRMFSDLQEKAEAAGADEESDDDDDDDDDDDEDDEVEDDEFDDDISGDEEEE